MDESGSPSAFQSTFQSTQTFVRKNGLQSPLSVYQVISWIIFIFDVLISFFIYLPPLILPLKILAASILFVFGTITFYYGYKAMTIDPTDPIVIEERKAKERGEEYQTQLRHFCIICSTHVQARTKHCGQCNRCVDTFDHHCIWLNNCIGASNYRHFIRAITALLIQSTIKIVFGIYLIVELHNHPQTSETVSREFYRKNVSNLLFRAFTIASCAINGIIWILVIKLLSLHIWLYFKDMTTYESIILQREVTPVDGSRESGRPPRIKKSRVIRSLEEGSMIDGSANKSNIQQNPLSENTCNQLKKNETRIHEQLFLSSEHKDDDEPSKNRVEFNMDQLPLGHSYRKEIKTKKFEIPQRLNSARPELKSLDLKNETSMSMLIFKGENGLAVTSNRNRPAQDSFSIQIDRSTSRRAATERRKDDRIEDSTTKMNEDKTKGHDKSSDKKIDLSNNDSIIPNHSRIKMCHWDTDVQEQSLQSIVEERITKHRNKEQSEDLKNITSKFGLEAEINAKSNKAYLRGLTNGSDQTGDSGIKMIKRRRSEENLKMTQYFPDVEGHSKCDTEVADVSGITILKLNSNVNEKSTKEI